ncbi:hypothetical protein [uncultured Microbacterium sp.]|uniref:hypothetical protein n=1 Tax=uncultured Microbacterium sp. TaxID=191216 RepID=UPI0025D2B789|nr:hypothetical protein [uncultured Microbacterium sp.]
MAYFIALGILAVAGIVGTVWLVRTDGYGRVPTDPRRAHPRRSVAPRAQRRAEEETRRPGMPTPRRAAEAPAGVLATWAKPSQRPAATARAYTSTIAAVRED